MLIYQDTTQQFINDVRESRISDIMTNNFSLHSGYSPIYSLVNSWQNSLSRVRDLIEIAGLDDNMIALEYEVPYNQNRIDCLLFGKGKDNIENIVLIELKQWSAVDALEDIGNYVETYTGGASRVVPHPSQQVEGYHNYLKGFVAEFDEEPPLMLFSCAYCHNYKKEDEKGLFNHTYQRLIDKFPIYCKDDVRVLASRIKDLLADGEGFEIFNRFMQSPIRPSKKLLENVSKVIKNEVVFSLLNEQLVAKNLIWSKVNRAGRQKEKSVIIVHGGPGTGKSVIAVNILAEAARRGKNVFYGCKSKPFIEGLKKLVGRDGALLFSNLYRFLPSKLQVDELDLLLIDEAHRIEKSSNHRYTKAEDRTDMPQVDQLIRAAKTSVFFIDDRQNVRSQEIGSSKLIQTIAKNCGCTLSEVTLETQYRCMGSNNYLLWLESVLGYSDTKSTLSKNDIFDFRIFDSPQAIYDELSLKENEKTNSARMVAGFCWPWSKELDQDGNLVKDVKIGNFAMPWETHGNITKPPSGFVKWYEWAYRPEGFKQVGCIYTAQGFEFDYVGVIIGNDLCYDKETDSLKADITATEDPTLKKSKENFEHHVKNIYRTLMTRGMKGCYVYFTDKETEQYFRGRIENERQFTPEIVKQFAERPFKIIEPTEDECYTKCIPLYDLKAAAGGFSDFQQVEPDEWVIPNVNRTLSIGMFVAQVVGKSMEPLIPDGSYCLFKFYTGGSRQGRIILAQHNSISDPDTGGRYTIKKYESKKVYNSDGGWRHINIKLKPLNPDFEPKTLETTDESEVQIIAELVEVLG